MSELHLSESQQADALARRFLSGELSRRELLRRAGAFSAGALALSTLGAVVAACGGTTSPSAPASGAPASTGTPKSGGVLLAALTGEPDTLDPATSAIYTATQVFSHIFSTLVAIDDKNEFYGVLATKWEQPDPLTWVFDLVDNATFHNGEKFTAEDVKYTFDRLLDPATGATSAASFDSIKSVEVVSPTQVRFTLKYTFGPFFINIVSESWIQNKKAIEAADPARNPVGTGPFEFVEWVQGDHVTLKKFDGYFHEGRPYLDGIEFKFRNVDQSRVEALRSGDLDWADAVPLQQLKTLAADPAFQYVTSPIAGIPDFLSLNCGKPPFDNMAFRQAIAWAVDRAQIRDIAYFGAGEVGSAEVPSGSTWFGGEDPYASGPDIEKAKAKLAEAGITTPFTIKYLGLPQYPELLKTGEVVRDNLKAIGITMEIEQVEVSVWFDRYVKGDYEITSAYHEGTIDPDYFYSLAIRSGASLNASFYANAEVDAMIDEAKAEPDESKRKELYMGIRQAVAEEAPVIFVHYETINYLMRKDVMGSTVNLTLEPRLEYVWLDR
ncbi:MAG TPA: ABC transporter substrate-binding protein [Candidatus Limnocylindrales bacterium]|nr:ABC transporter substrate-binding protein [Candidatus Limnocylindrales bacterium]